MRNIFVSILSTSHHIAVLAPYDIKQSLQLTQWYKIPI